MNKLRTVIARVLQVEEAMITEEASPLTIETWDSFNALMLVSELENVFKVKFTLEEVTGVKCVRDIKDNLLKRGVDING